MAGKMRFRIMVKPRIPTVFKELIEGRKHFSLAHFQLSFARFQL